MGLEDLVRDYRGPGDIRGRASRTLSAEDQRTAWGRSQTHEGDYLLETDYSQLSPDTNGYR